MTTRDDRVKELNRKLKVQLVMILQNHRARAGIRQVAGTPPGRWSKDELIREILAQEGLA